MIERRKRPGPKFCQDTRLWVTVVLWEQGEITTEQASKEIGYATRFLPGLVRHFHLLTAKKQKRMRHNAITRLERPVDSSRNERTAQHPTEAMCRR